MIRSLLIANRGEIARRVMRTAILACAVWLQASAASAQLGPHPEEYLAIRSDVPLWSEVDDGVWPRSHQSETGFGFHSIFRPGDWRLVESELCENNEVKGSPCEKWVRLRFRSVFHGAFGWMTASTREGLRQGNDQVGVIAPLDDTDPRRARLYAVQLGVNPGSEYILVSVVPISGGDITRMTVLAAQCETNPNATIRRGPPSVWINDYCVVRTRAALKSLARQALSRKPFGYLEWVGPSPAEEAR